MTWTVPDTAVCRLEHAGRTWRLVAGTTGGGPPAPGRGLPTVYLLDPFGTFGSTLQIARTTRWLCGAAFPELLVVGVGPDTDDLAELVAARRRDLVPEEGGEAFLDLLTGVVARYAEDRLGAGPEGRTIAGWSLGGLLGAHALATRPGAFSRYLLVSPSLYWDGAAVFHRLAAAPGKVAGEVYLAVGEREQGAAELVWPPPDDLPAAEAARASAAMVGNTHRFADALRQRGAPRVLAETIADEHHNTVWAAAATRGLRWLHATGTAR